MMKTAIKTALLGTALAFVAAAPAQAQQAGTTTVDVQLKGYVFGFSVIKARYGGNFTDNAYSLRADVKTAGLGALLKKMSIWATTTGFFDGADLLPLQHIQQNQDKKNRRVEMNYSQNALDISIVPRLGSQGKPPATTAQRFGSDDTLSALLNIMMRGYKTSTEPCTGDVAVFDSKQHYILRMKRDGTKRIRQKGFKGETIRCKIYYIPVSGFDPEDMPSAEEQAAPIMMYLGNFPDANLYIPVRMTYKISGFKAVIKARKITITKN